MARFEIVIDPGHGGQNAAAHSSALGVRGPGGTLEKDVTLRIADRLAGVLGQRATLTRRTDDNLTLAQRADVSKQSYARAFVSIHANEGRPGQRGAEGWVHERAGEGSRALATRVLRELGRIPGSPPDHGVREAPLAVLTPERHGDETAACLVEVDYLSDPDGERRLTDAAATDAIAEAIARGIEGWLAQPSNAVPMQGEGYGRRRARYGTGETKRALVVGINDYSQDPASWPILTGCIGDANAIVNLLQRPEIGFDAANIQRLSDQAATRSAILGALRSLMTASQAGDVLCFYYAGHGGYVPDPDTSMCFAQSLHCADGGELLDRDLASLVKSTLPDGVNFTIILDSCQSGGMGEVAGVPDVSRGGPLPPEMTVEGASISVKPIGLCDARITPDIRTTNGTIIVSNARLVCERRPNTTVVPFAQATLFSAVDFAEQAGEHGGRGDYTRAFERVITSAGRALTYEEVQRGVVEEIERMRQDGRADPSANPMLRGQGSRLRGTFLAGFINSEVGLSLPHDRRQAAAYTGRAPASNGANGYRNRY